MSERRLSASLCLAAKSSISTNKGPIFSPAALALPINLERLLRSVCNA